MLINLSFLTDSSVSVADQWKSSSDVSTNVTLVSRDTWGGLGPKARPVPSSSETVRIVYSTVTVAGSEYGKGSSVTVAGREYGKGSSVTLAGSEYGKESSFHKMNFNYNS